MGKEYVLVSKHTVIADADSIRGLYHALRGKGLSHEDTAMHMATMRILHRTGDYHNGLPVYMDIRKE